MPQWKTIVYVFRKQCWIRRTCFISGLVFISFIAQAEPNCFAPQNASNVADNNNIEQQRQQARKTLAGISQQCLIEAAALKHYKTSPTYVFPGYPAPVGLSGLNIELGQIKTKTYLKNEMLVIVPEGPQLHQPLYACQQLRAMGFSKTYVLLDGLKALLSFKSAPRKSKIHNAQSSITVRQLFLEKDARDWLILTDTRTSTKRLERYFKDTKKLNILNNSTIKVAKKYLASSSRRGLPKAVLFITDKKEERHRLGKFINQQDYLGMYYMDATLTEFYHFLDKQYAITSKRELVLNKPRSCTN